MGLVSRIQKTLFDPWKEMRRQRRTHLNVHGKVFVPEKQHEEQCLVLDLSPDGAGLKSACTAPVGTHVVLYVDGLGRFEGTIVRHNRLYLGVQFKYSKTARARIADRIWDYVNQRSPIHKSTRDSSRQVGAETPHSFILESGQSHACCIVDIALSGVSFETAERPAVGERVFFSNTAWVVVRHTEVGFAVAFLESSEPGPVAAAP
jgi:hypothetical protein